ncbi:peritrophin-48 [Drosophila eugracilis]|uniref:peritrophin-48 n=1 Tax=Drosophila eugracilis TaxID=29029 RepID=UPI0007E5D656|nr:peritrophin-48 [Drosophila eugracilis]
MTGKLLLVTILCLMGGSALAADVLEGTYNVTAVCTAVPTGTQLGSIESCQYYYVCQSSGPVNTTCQSGYSYDYKKSSCYPSSQVECYYGVENPCQGLNGTWVPNTSVCGGYYYCDNSVCRSGACPVNQVFDSTTKACKWGSCTTTADGTEGTVLNSLCDVVPPGFYYGDTSNCSTWNYCQSNSSGIFLHTGTCSGKQTTFNVNGKSCDYKSSTDCSRVTGNGMSSAPVSCDTNGAKKADASVCGTYYVCTNKQWVATYCASGYYYDETQEICVLRQTATPIAGCNRCQYASQSFVNAVDSDNCASYYYCNKQGVATSNTCPDDHFFNESVQGCVTSTEEVLAAYVKSNGACKGATVDGSDSTDATEATTVKE